MQARATMEACRSGLIASERRAEPMASDGATADDVKDPRAGAQVEDDWERPQGLATMAGRSAMPPTITNGKICYIEIPASDVQRSADFYRAVFGWDIRRRSDGALAFDDGVGEVSGTWVLGRPPSTQAGLLVYIMVGSVEETCRSVVANEGEVVQEIGADTPEVTARFRDPGGNVMGLYEERS
jgi:predicted enzyme related to lactoylglutathione lyase